MLCSEPMRGSLLLVSVLLAAVAPAGTGAEKLRPLMRDFIGINGHTVQFKPELYAPVAKLVRVYHPVGWDLGDDTDFTTTFPFARNRVDWSRVYGAWRAHDLRIHACLQFDAFAPAAWKNPARDAAAYGEAFARFFGPSGRALVETVQIGNEPGTYSDAQYREIFESMAGGIRKGDPGLRIATCAADIRGTSKYYRGMQAFAGLETLYDIINIHVYAEAEPWPTFRRSYPEDPAIDFLPIVRDTLKWRDENAPSKEVWITEFGWDASTKPAPPTGDFAKWQGSSETQQAQWIVRAWLVLSATALDRAYLYMFNDNDTPHIHGSSGLTRNFEPKQSYHAAAWLQRSLGEYRFTRVLREDAADCFAYEFTHGERAGERIVAVWKPSGAEATTTLPLRLGDISRAERMPLRAAPAEAMAAQTKGEDAVQVPAGESPVFLWLRSERQ